MSRIVLFFALLPSLFILSCATAGGGPDGAPAAGPGKMLESNPAAKPEWLSITGYARKGFDWYFVGESSKSRTEEDARAKALLNGLAQISNQFGVKVSSELISQEKESNGNYSYDIGVKNKLTGAPIRIKDYKLDGTYIEKWDRGAVEFDAKVLVKVPDEEIARIRKEIDALCGWAVLTPRAELTGDAMRLVKEFAQVKKFNLKPDADPVGDAYTIETLSQKAADSAFFLVVKVKAADPKNVDGEWYSDVAVEVEYISLTENKVIRSYSGSARGAAYADKDAVKSAFLKAFDEIMTQ